MKGLTVKNIDINKLHLKQNSSFVPNTTQKKKKASDIASDRFSLHVKGMIHWYKYSNFIRSIVNYMLINILVDSANNPDNQDTSIIDIVQKQLLWGS